MRIVFGMLILLFGMAFNRLSGWYPDVAWFHSFPVSVGLPVIVGLMGVGILVGSRNLKRRDPSLAGWLALSLCGCLLLVPLLIAKAQQEQFDDKKWQEVVRLREELRAEMRRQAQMAFEEARSAQAERSRDRFTQYEGRVDVVSLEKIRTLDQKMEAALKEKSEAYREALETYPTRGPDAWVTMQSLEELSRERAAHLKLYEAARGFTQFVESFEAEYTEQLQKLDLKPPADRVAIAEMERVLQFARANRVYELRKLDVEAIGAALAALNILSDNWSNWSFDRRSQSLSFDDPASEAAFQAALSRLMIATEAVESITAPPHGEN